MMSKTKRWPLRVVLRYVILQIPELALLTLILYALFVWFSVALWMLALIFCIWIAKDFILFFFVWKAYQIPAANKDQHFVGETGVVTTELSPQGYIRIRGELWKAKSMTGSNIRTQEEVYVVEQKGLLLIVDHYSTEE